MGFDLRCQMEDAGYLGAAPPFWHDNAWRLRFRPAPRRADAMRRLQPLRRRWREWTRPPEGSPRAYAPRFDGEFFGNWMRRLTALGVFSSIFASLVQTRVRLEELRAIDLAAWNADPGSQRVPSLLTIAEGLVLCLLAAISIDPAYYTARRLYRVTGLSVAGLTTLLFILFFLCGAGLFIIAESARQITAELNAQMQARPD